MSNLSKNEHQQQIIAQKLYRKLKHKKSLSKCVEIKDKTKCNSKSQGNGKSHCGDGALNASTADVNEDLRRRAIDEICRDTHRSIDNPAGLRSCGWRANPMQKTNKRFLVNTMQSVINHNKRTTVKNARESERKFDALNKRKPKFGTRLHSFQSSKERLSKQSKTNF